MDVVQYLLAAIEIAWAESLERFCTRGTYLRENGGFLESSKEGLRERALGSTEILRES